MHWPRQKAYQILLRVGNGAYSDVLLQHVLEQEPQRDERDRRLLTELVYGVLRQQGALDFALDRFCKRPVASLDKGMPELLRLGAYQLLFLERVPAHAAVATSVDLAKQNRLQRVAGLVNGVLRALVRQRQQIPWPRADDDAEAYLCHSLSLPRWLARRWCEQYGIDEAMELARACLQAAPRTLRVNTLVTSRQEVQQQLAADSISTAPCSYAPAGVTLPAGSGWTLPLPPAAYHWQDEASQLVAYILAPQPGEHILDACAAPGGKTSHIAALMAKQGQLQAVECHESRMRTLHQLCERLQCADFVSCRQGDMTQPPSWAQPASYDGVLLDAPCSGLGVLRRNPELRWRLGSEDIARLAALQCQLLDSCAPLVKPGGRLVYAVCTQTPEETSRQVTAFLKRWPAYRQQKVALPNAGQAVAPVTVQGAFAPLPQQYAGMDAFYAVCLQRQPER